FEYGKSYGYYFKVNGEMDRRSVSRLHIPEVLLTSENTETGDITEPAESVHEFDFVVGSCIYEGYKPFTIFKWIYERNPDFVLYIGDQVYADLPTLIEEKRVYEEKVICTKFAKINNSLFSTRLISMTCIYHNCYEQYRRL